MIVDAHVHLLPERLAAKIRRFFEDRGAPRMPYPYAPEAARRHLVEAGITRCWSLPYAHRAGVAGPLNRWMAETWGADSRVVPGATVHPDDDVAAIVGEAIDHLGTAVFKLHCSVGAFSPEDPRLDPLWARVSENGRPVVVHAGGAAEGTATAEEVEAVGRVAVRWPGARIVIAHFGSPAVERTLALLRERPNLYADLCPVVGDPVGLSRESIAGLERRVLFGSDTPTVAVTIEDSIARVKSWKLDPGDEEAILGGTANGLLDLAG
jgi:predicted TIM-barrel fold metal-dependent hydrolase